MLFPVTFVLIDRDLNVRGQCEWFLIWLDDVADIIYVNNNYCNIKTALIDTFLNWHIERQLFVLEYHNEVYNGNMSTTILWNIFKQIRVYNLIHYSFKTLLKYINSILQNFTNITITLEKYFLVYIITYLNIYNIMIIRSDSSKNEY